MSNFRNASLVLKTSDLTLNSVNTVGECDSKRTKFTWYGIRLRTLLGDMYDQFDLFNLCLNTIATNNAAITTINTINRNDICTASNILSFPYDAGYSPLISAGNTYAVGHSITGAGVVSPCTITAIQATTSMTLSSAQSIAAGTALSFGFSSTLNNASSSTDLTFTLANNFLAVNQLVTGNGIVGFPSVVTVNGTLRTAITLSTAQTITAATTLTYFPIVVTATTTVASSDTTMTFLAANIIGVVVNQRVFGTGVPPGVTVVSIAGGVVTVSAAVNVLNAATIYFTSASAGTSNNNNTSSSTNVTFSAAVNLAVVGQSVTGAGIPANTTVTAVNSTTSITLSNPAALSVGAALTFSSGTVTTNNVLNNAQGLTFTSFVPLPLINGLTISGGGILFSAGVLISNLITQSFTLSSAQTIAANTPLTFTGTTTTLGKVTDDRQVVMKISGLPFINQTYDVKNQKNGSTSIISAFTFNANTFSTQYFNDISVATFGKNQDLCNLTIEYARVSDGNSPDINTTSIPINYFPQVVFIFDILGVLNEYIEPQKRISLKSYHP